MLFLKRHKTAISLVAVLVVAAGVTHFSTSGCPLSGTELCPIASLFSASTAYAGPGCSSASKTASSCDAGSKSSNVTAASATSADGKTCTKEECVKAIMAEKKISREEAEAVYTKMEADGSCHGAASKASAQTAAGASGCTGHGTATASFANATEGKTCGDKEACITKCMAEKGYTRAQAEECYAKCQAEKATTASASGGCSAHGAGATTASAAVCPHATNASFANATESKTCGDKEACITKCMAEKGYTRAQAEECYAKCQAAKATQANVITGSGFTRDAWIDAKVASGLTRADAEVAAAKAEASGDVKFVTAGASGCSASKASATGGSCCASKASANATKVEETTPATTTTTVNTGGSK